MAGCPEFEQKEKSLLDGLEKFRKEHHHPKAGLRGARVATVGRRSKDGNQIDTVSGDNWTFGSVRPAEVLSGSSGDAYNAALKLLDIANTQETKGRCETAMKSLDLALRTINKD